MKILGGWFQEPRFCNLVLGHDTCIPRTDSDSLKLDRQSAASEADWTKNAVSSAYTRHTALSYPRCRFKSVGQFHPIRICVRYWPTIVRQNLKVRQFAVQILTAETIKIWKFHTSQLLVCNQYASRWTLINILGLSSWPPPQCSLDISHIGIVCCVHFRPQILCSCIVLFVKVLC